MKNLLHALVLFLLLFAACGSSMENEALNQATEPSVNPNYLLPLQ